MNSFSNSSRTLEQNFTETNNRSKSSAMCIPTIVYVVFSLVHIIIDFYKGNYTTAFIEILVTVAIALLLNFLCAHNLTMLAWLIVFIPFIFMTIVTSIMILFFSKNPNDRHDRDRKDRHDRHDRHDRDRHDRNRNNSNHDDYEDQTNSPSSQSPREQKTPMTDDDLSKKIDMHIKENIYNIQASNGNEISNNKNSKGHLNELCNNKYTKNNINEEETGTPSAPTLGKCSKPTTNSCKHQHCDSHSHPTSHTH